MTPRDLVAFALSCERAARWSEAKRAWEEARRKAGSGAGAPAGGSPPTSPLASSDSSYASRERVRARQNGLAIGTALRRSSPSGDLVCVYEAERRFVYDGRVFTSLSGAAEAAGKDIGIATKNGWQFWGLEKRKENGSGGRRI